jgi:hypothetical protein
MNAAEVISRLIELEGATIKCDRSTIHALLLRVEEGVLHLEKLTIETLRENATLRQRLEKYERPRSRESLHVVSSQGSAS